MWKRVAFASIFGFALLSACSDGNSGGGLSGPDEGPGFLSRCNGTVCKGGLICAKLGINETLCTQACPDGTCPEGSACGKDENGSPVCTSPCTPLTEIPTSSYRPPGACENGARVACSQAAEGSCAECGCGDSRRCEIGVGCSERLAEGTPCKVDGDCKSENCGKLTGVCNVPMGAACIDASCDLCVKTGDGSYCTRTCGFGSEDCRGGFSCGTDAGSDESRCFPGCAGCEDKNCKFFSNSSKKYCDCSGCGITRGKGIEGVECTTNAACLSGFCNARACAKPCTADADCFGLERCVEGQGLKTPVCVSCSGCQVCKTGTSVDGAEAKWCDTRKNVGEACTKAEECSSDACTGGKCGSGVENGGSCTAASQCASKNCIQGSCRGDKLLGDPCSTSADCSVGGCCKSGSSAGKCGSGC